MGEGRTHGLAVDIEDTPGERCAGDPVGAGVVTAGVGIELGLHGVEPGGGDDCRMAPWMSLVLVHDQVEIGAVAQQVKQRAAAEGQAPHHPAAAGRAALGSNPACIKPALQRWHRTQFKIGLEYRAHGRGFGLVDDQCPRSVGRYIVTERHGPHPSTCLWLWRRQSCRGYARR